MLVFYLLAAAALCHPPRPLSLTVHVTSVSGAPAAGVRVLEFSVSDVADALRSGRQLPSKVADAQGSCQFESAGSAPFLVAAELPGTESLAKGADGRQGPLFVFKRGGASSGPVELGLPGEGRGALRGHVTIADGEPAPSAHVLILSGPKPDEVPGETCAPYQAPEFLHAPPGSTASFGPVAAERAAGADGAFEFSALPAGTYQVLASAGPGKSGRLATVEIRDGQTAALDFSFPLPGPPTPGKFIGLGGEPPPGLLIFLVDPKSNNAAYAAVDKDGTFAVDLPDADYTIEAFQLCPAAGIPCKAEKGPDGDWIVRQVPAP